MVKIVVGDIEEGTDLLVIGAGPGGYTAAIRAAQNGKEVVLVDKEEVGGICLNHGCIPAKSLIHAAGFQEDIQHWEEIGIHTDNLEVDFEKIQEWKNSVVKRLDNGIKSRLSKHGVEFKNGKAFFQDSNTARIEMEHNAETVKFDNAIIATGSKPIEIPGLEFDKKKIISSRELLELDEVPDEIVVVGGGYIGMEAVTKFCKFGSKVKVVEATENVLPGFDQELVDRIQEVSECYNDEIYTETEAKKVKYKDNKAILVAEKEDKEIEIAGDYILVAAGRTAKPALEELELDNTDVEIEDDFITVDDQLKTDDENIYAIGDAAGQPMLAHKAYREGKVAANVISGENDAMDNQYIPKVIYTDPEIAVAGMTPDEARERYRSNIKIGKFPFSASGRALTTNQEDGFIKVVAEENGKILGVQILGPRASDMIAEATLALEMQAYLEDITRTIHAHPTFPEAFAEACEDAKNESVHVS
ncbi:MAG: dihydrolipoyl dehydrogenase [Nanohaloarchaea archaeon SW_4_43_9]|nr:MAG: dihydrolipoyl dehydrogenase [Nanohaloarchaea archaeon SW_4_43_9]